MRKAFKSLLLAFTTLIAGTVAYAQVTTSSLSGRVVDQTGEPVIGAAIVATHEPSGTVYGAVTNADGRYTIQGMRTGGPYKVDFSCLGYQEATYTGVTLQLAETYSLDAKIAESNEMLEGTIVIASPSSKFASVEKMGAATNISSSQMLELPTVSRSVTDVLKLSPYGGNGTSFAGASGRFSNFTVDGANMNYNFGLSSSSLPGGGNPISIDAIEEMQVVVSPYDVRQSNFTSGGINAITKSGTNTFRGTAYVYHRNENMHGNRIDNVELSERAIDRKTTYGFTLGGPIVKNKLFFFVNAEHSVIPTSVNNWKPSSDGIADKDRNITRVRESEAIQMQNFLKTTYGYDVGSYNSFPADESNTKILARIDWNITNKHHLALRYNYTNNTYWNMPSSSRDVSDFTVTSGGNTTLSENGMYFSSAMYSMNNKVNTWSLDLNSRFTDNLSNQFLATYSDMTDVRGSNSSEFPFVEIMAGDLGEEYATEPYMGFGYELFTWKNRVANTVLNIKDDITWYAGAHKVMGGISFESQMALNTYMRNGTGMYRFASMSDFYAGKAPVEMAFDWGYNGVEDPSAKVRFNQIGLYVQDEWNVTDRFKLTAGIRFDTLLFNNNDVMTNNAIKALDYNGRNIDTGLWPKTSVQISPRLGFSWDVLGDKSLKIRGGTGLFSGRLPLVFFTNMPTNSGMVKGRLTKFKDPAVLAQMMQGGKMVTDKWEILNILNASDAKKYPKEISPETGVLPSEIAGVDPNFKMPQVWRSSIAVDYNFPTPFPLSITGEFIFNKTVNAVMLTNYNITEDNAGWTTFNGADNRHMYPASYKYQRVDAFMLTNTNKGYGWVSTISLNAQPLENLNITAAWTHTVNKEITAMPGSNATAAWKYIPSVEGPNFNSLHSSSFVNPDRLMASISYTDPGRNHYSILYEGWRYGGRSFIYSNDMNGDGNPYDLMYIPTDEQIANGSYRFDTPADRDNYVAFAAQDKYLSSNKGQYAEAYAVTAPWVHTFDFRYAHDFVVKIGSVKNTLQLSLDLVNAGNLFNSSWGVAKTFSKDVPSSGGILKYVRTDPDGVPVFSTNVPAGAKTWDLAHTYANCWYMQIGIKYLFN
ncbi:MAG: TonB-dependent receptor [Bacteroidales bacterium]|nr:TonB-dependent receptor [Bacteroidales bacterium]